MSSVSSNIFLSDIDKERFGIQVARVVGVTTESLSSILEFCRKKQVKLLIARCSLDDLKAAQSMEREGFLLMDTLVYYMRDLTGQPIASDNGRALVRPIRVGEEENVRLVALESFRDYVGHYHADQRLDNDKCDELYADWARKSCALSSTDKFFLVAEIEGKIVGFAALRINNPDEGEWVLGGIHPDFKGQGIYQSVLCRVMEWCLFQGAKRIIISTQLKNISLQKVWEKFGFKIDRGYYTFHKWYD